MRTKALLLAAAISAAGIVASQAQSNVYSLNVVGYVNISLATGYNLISNPLDLDGTGTNNTVNTVFSNSLPSGSVVYAFAGGSFSAATYSTKGGWAGATAAANAALQPGGGVFVSVPSASTVTVVGNVLQGALSQGYGAGYTIISSKVPQAGLMQTDLGFVPASGTIVYEFDGATQNYLSPVKGYSTKGGWAPGQPNIAVGGAVFLNSPTSGSWNRNFTVN